MGWVGGLTLDFRQMLPVVTNDQGRSGKMDHFGGMYCCLGGLMGPPGEIWGWGGWAGGLILDFRLTLPVFIHDRGCSGKMDCFGGMYCCLGGLMGPPIVPGC